MKKITGLDILAGLILFLADCPFVSAQNPSGM
jgi:hypothetical protein